MFVGVDVLSPSTAGWDLCAAACLSQSGMQSSPRLGSGMILSFTAVDSKGKVLLLVFFSLDSFSV